MEPVIAVLTKLVAQVESRLAHEHLPYVGAARRLPKTAVSVRWPCQQRLRYWPSRSHRYGFAFRNTVAYT